MSTKWNKSQTRELRLAQEAIALVAAGRTRRVVIAGIRHGDLILVSAQRLALAQRVLVSPLQNRSGGLTDLVVEPAQQ